MFKWILLRQSDNTIRITDAMRRPNILMEYLNQIFQLIIPSEVIDLDDKQVVQLLQSSQSVTQKAASESRK